MKTLALVLLICLASARIVESGFCDFFSALAPWVTLGLSGITPIDQAISMSANLALGGCGSESMTPEQLFQALKPYIEAFVNEKIDQNNVQNYEDGVRKISSALNDFILNVKNTNTQAVAVDRIRNFADAFSYLRNFYFTTDNLANTEFRNEGIRIKAVQALPKIAMTDLNILREAWQKTNDTSYYCAFYRYRTAYPTFVNQACDAFQTRHNNMDIKRTGGQSCNNSGYWNCCAVWDLTQYSFEMPSDVYSINNHKYSLSCAQACIGGRNCQGNDNISDLWNQDRALSDNLLNICNSAKSQVRDFSSMKADPNDNGSRAGSCITAN